MDTAVVLQDVKYPHNVAAAIRACACFGADQLFWTGGRVELPNKRLPREERLRGYRAVQWARNDKPFEILKGFVPVCVELSPTAQSLVHFVHPRGPTAYVFGPEDGHISQAFRKHCHEFIYIPAHHCLNLAAAVNVVLLHRHMQRVTFGLEESFHPAVTEHRGLIDIPGWEGK